MNDRIRLAEAMNLPEQSTYTYRVGMNIYEDQPERTELGVDEFNPFEDANDDYAVLEWMRREHANHEMPSQMTPIWAQFSNRVMAGSWYRIGDYARAALKVIE